ncbi:MAG: NAD(P)-dependent oxidoreductase [Candidatus Adiutrix sp.]|jgi:UDP-glucose 4-epimerase|nr:NAD(P)-dependent oxidoreductase [Candidatus Adiutrix sp.]
MKVTVFGGSGFLGSHSADKLSEAGHEVTIFDIRPSPWLRPDQQMIVGDILDDGAVSRAVTGANAVYNYAGLADIGEANLRPVDTAAYNVLGNVKVLEASRQACVGRFIFASTLYVYGKSGGFYRCSKQASELYVEHYRQEYGLEYTILRYGSLYGPRADRRNGIYKFVREAMETGVITYYGTPEALRNYINVEDAAICSVDILDAAFADTNIVLTGQQSMRVTDLFKMISEILGRPLQYNFAHDEHSNHYDITPYAFHPRLGKKMAPRCSVDLGQGLLSIIEDIHRELNPHLNFEMAFPCRGGPDE